MNLKSLTTLHIVYWGAMLISKAYHHPLHRMKDNPSHIVYLQDMLILSAHPHPLT